MGNKAKAEARAKRRKAKAVKKIVIWVVVLAGAGALIFFLVGSSGDGTGNSGGIPPVTTNDWVKWNREAPVVLLEYSDFQCPACGSYFPLLNAVELEYGDKAAFVYRHYPIAQIHFNANAAARAAEAAGKQGKFWEMHDRLFQTQELWSSMSASDASAVFAGYAKNFKDEETDTYLDVNRYLEDFNSDEVSDRVTAQYTGGLTAGVNSTPSFFLNGEKIRNPSDIEGFRALLDEALANAESDPQ